MGNKFYLILFLLLPLNVFSMEEGISNGGFNPLDMLKNFGLGNIGKEEVVEQTEEEKAFYADIDNTVKDAEEITKNIDPEKILQDIADQKEKEQSEKRDKAIAKIKDNNTIIYQGFRYPYIDRDIDSWDDLKKARLKTDKFPYLAVYKSDVVKTGFLALNVAKDIYVYKQILKNRIEFVLNVLIKDADALIDLITKLKEAEVTKKRVDILKAQNNLKKHLKEKYTYIKRNPFKSELLPAIVGNYISSRLSSYLENKILGNDILCEELFTAYRKNAKGELEPIGLDDKLEKYEPVTTTKKDYWGNVSKTTTYVDYRKNKKGEWVEADKLSKQEWQEVQENNIIPVSISSVLNHFMLPVPLFLKIIAAPHLFMAGKVSELSIILNNGLKDEFGIDTNKGFNFLNKALGLNIPEFLFSETANTIVRILGFGLGVKLFDASTEEIWVNNVLKEKNKLLDLLIKYKKTHEITDDQVEQRTKIELELKNFVNKANSPGSWNPFSVLNKWRNLKFAGFDKVNFIRSVPLLSVLAYKGYKFYKQCTN